MLQSQSQSPWLRREKGGLVGGRSSVEADYCSFEGKRKWGEETLGGYLRVVTIGKMVDTQEDALLRWWRG